MIPEDLIEDWLGSVFGHSDPGDIPSRLLVVRAGPDACNAFGMPDPKKLEVTFMTLAPDYKVDADVFIVSCIETAIVEAARANETVFFAALAVEMNSLDMTAVRNEVDENRARRMAADRKLQEHPAAQEVTRLYAACRDGRRWVGNHYLTGPKAGAKEGPSVLIGPLQRRDGGLQARLIRYAVGQA